MSITIEETLTRGVENILPDTATLLSKAKNDKLKLYLGIDPTGSLLHLGHAVVLRKLQQFATLGHQVTLLIGNGTVRIGDPTGRDSTRPVLTDQAIAQNFQNWQAQASKIIDFSQISIRHNGDWLDKLTYTDIVKLMAQTTIQQLMERDMFAKRQKDGLPIFGHEIIYPLLQGYDSVALDVDLEIGGSDQMFNMMMGRQLQKNYHNHSKWVLTTPIINGTDGRKMSKSYQNFVALTDSAQDIYFKLMTIADTEIIPYFTILTDIPLKQIESYQQEIAAGQNPLIFKKILAKQITSDLHDAQAATAAATAWQSIVSEKKLPDNLPQIKVSSFTLPLIELAKLAQPDTSNSQIRRLHDQGALELLDNHVLRIGKKNFYQLVLN